MPESTPRKHQDNPILTLKERVASARHESVTEDVLTKKRQSRFLRSDLGWLHKLPLVQYLNDDEQPHFIFASTQAVNGGVAGYIAPTPPYRAFCCLTDQRLLILVGREPSNSVLKFGLDEIREFGIKPGEKDPGSIEDIQIHHTSFRPVLRFSTRDNLIEFSVSESVTLEDMEKVSEFLLEVTSLAGWAYSDWWASVKSERERKQVARKNERKRQEEAERKEAERRRNQEKLRSDILEYLLTQSTSSTVTRERLVPILDYLDIEDGETVDFILTFGSRIIRLKSAADEPISQTVHDQIWTAFTSKSVITCVEGSVEFIDYGQILDVSAISGMSESEAEWTYILLTTDDLQIAFNGTNLTHLHFQDLLTTVRRRIEEHTVVSQ